MTVDQTCTPHKFSINYKIDVADGIPFLIELNKKKYNLIYLKLYLQKEVRNCIPN